MGLAHLVDDAVRLVLDLAGSGDVALLDQLVHLEEQLGHDGVGAADAAVRAHDTAGDELLIGAVEHGEAVRAARLNTGILEHLDVLGGHRGVLDRDDVGVLEHLVQQGHRQGGTGQLRDVVDDELGVGRGGAHGVPVVRDGVVGQVEVDRRDGRDGVNAALFSMGGQLDGICRVVAGDMGNNGDLALGLAHDGLQHGLALIRVLVDALAGGAADVNALDALGDQVAGQCLDALGGDGAVRCVAGVEGGDNAAIFVDVFHIQTLPVRKTVCKGFPRGGNCHRR